VGSLHEAWGSRGFLGCKYQAVEDPCCPATFVSLYQSTWYYLPKGSLKSLAFYRYLQICFIDEFKFTECSERRLTGCAGSFSVLLT
jgi:hypothetical protein